MPVAKIHDPTDKKIVAYCEWLVVDEEGQPDDLGSFVFIRELWIHHNWRRKNLIKTFVRIISDKAPSATEAYWERRKYGNRLKQFPRWKLLGYKEKEK